MSKMNIMNYKVFINELEGIDVTKRQVVNTINPHSYVTAKRDKLFHEALISSDILIPDGSGIVFAAKQLYSKNIKKIAGYNLHDYLLNKMNMKGGKVFYMGASEKTLNIIKKKIKNEYPNIEVEAYSPPYKDDFTEEENSVIIEKINAFNPDVLFVGMTAPKQEKWLHKNKDQLKFTIASSIGAVFDFYAEVVPRPSDFWVDLHLEWLVRFLAEPKRLWKRNFVSTPKFIFDVLLFRLDAKKHISYQ